MYTDKHSPQTHSRFSKILGAGAVIILVSALGYCGNKMVQSYLGQKAIDETGLELRTTGKYLYLLCCDGLR